MESKINIVKKEKIRTIPMRWGDQFSYFPIRVEENFPIVPISYDINDTIKYFLKKQN